MASDVMLCFWKGMTMFVALHLQDYFGNRILLLVGNKYVMREILLLHVITLSVTAVYHLRLGLLRVRVLVASPGQFPVITAVYQEAEDKPNSLNVETGLGYRSSMFVCGAAQWVELRENEAQFEIFDFVRCLKIYLGGRRTFQG